MRKLFLFLLFLLPAALFAESGTYIVEKLSFYPPEFYVGDDVEAVVKLQLSRTVEMSPPEILPEGPYIAIKEVTLSQEDRTVTVRIRFSSFRQGNGSFPEIECGLVTLEGINFYTDTLLSEETELIGMRGQLLTPGTYLIILVIVLILFLVPFTFVLLRKLFYRQLKVFRKRRQKRLPGRHLVRGLRNLEKNLIITDSKEFYSHISGLLKIYFTQRTGNDFLSATTRELIDHSRVILDDPEEEMLKNILEYGDLVKFADEQVSYLREINDLETVRKIYLNYEKKGVPRG